WGFDADPAQGWWHDIEDGVNTRAVCNAFGRYLATGHGAFAGFASRKNIIWMHGSDYGQQASNPPDAEGEQRMLQLLQALVAGGATQLRGGDWEAPSLSTSEPVFASSMTINGVYTYGSLWNGVPGNLPMTGTTYQEALLGWTEVPPLPAF